MSTLATLLTGENFGNRNLPSTHHFYLSDGEGAVPSCSPGPSPLPQPSQGLAQLQGHFQQLTGWQVVKLEPILSDWPIDLQLILPVSFILGTEEGPVGFGAALQSPAFFSTLRESGRWRPVRGPRPPPLKSCSPCPLQPHPRPPGCEPQPPHLRGLLPRRAAQPSLHFRPGSNLSPELAPGNGGSLLPP